MQQCSKWNMNKHELNKNNIIHVEKYGCREGKETEAIDLSRREAQKLESTMTSVNQ